MPLFPDKNIEWSFCQFWTVTNEMRLFLTFINFRNASIELPFHPTFSPSPLITFSMLFFTLQLQKMHLMSVYRCFSLVSTHFWLFFNNAHCLHCSPFYAHLELINSEYVVQIGQEGLWLLSYGNLFYWEILKNKDVKGVWGKRDKKNNFWALGSSKNKEIWNHGIV